MRILNMSTESITSTQSYATRLENETRAEKKARRRQNRQIRKKAFLGASAAYVATTSLASPVAKNLSVFSRNLSPDRIAQINAAADRIIQDTPVLNNNGVKIVNFKNYISFSLLPDWLEKKMNINAQIADGRNACFVASGKNTLGEKIKNLVYVNREKLPMATFHELGHAHNFNTSAAWRVMQKGRLGWMGLAAAISMIPLFTKESKPEEGKELTAGQKFKNWVRKASPALAFTAMLPMLAEEAAASIKGCKMAKPLLDKALYSGVVKTNALAYTSYLALAAGSAVFALVAKKIKDKNIAKQEQEQQQLQQQQQQQMPLETVA